ncbi:MAG: efflux RND transporter periplasmic adaptor subunit [Gemmataceae bacterium]
MGLVLWASIFVLLALGGAATAYFSWGTIFSDKQRYTGLTATTEAGPFAIRVVERGELKSASNTYVICRVNAGKSAQIKITWVIPDGTIIGPEHHYAPQKLCIEALGQMAAPAGFSALAGISTIVPNRLQKLIQLDAEAFDEELAAQRIKVDQALAAWNEAKEEYKITKSQNESDKLIATTTKKLAKMDIEKYLEGDYPVSLNTLKAELNNAESDLKLWLDRSDWSRRMEIKGYVSSSQASSDAAKAESARLTYKNKLTEKSVLEGIAKERMLLELNSKLEEAKQALQRVEISNKANLSKAESDRESKRKIFEQELAQQLLIEDKIFKCTLYAFQPGLVVYHVPQQSRWGRGSQQSIIAPGEPVTNNQKLLEIPDLSQMMVKANVHEAMVRYLLDDDKVKASKSFLRVDAYPNSPPLAGHVKTVATTASQQDWLSSDVKVYETTIEIDTKKDGLKPGMNCEVTIFAYESPEPVITVPIQAVVGRVTDGKTRKCYVIDEDGYAEQRDIVLGKNNETHVVVLSGLQQGDTVALDPESLLPPDSEMRAAPAGKSRGFGGKGQSPSGKKKKGKPGKPAGKKV